MKKIWLYYLMEWHNRISKLLAVGIVYVSLSFGALYGDEVITGLPEDFEQLIKEKRPNAEEIVKDTYTDKDSYYGSSEATLLASKSNTAQHLDSASKANYYNALIHVLMGLGKYLEELEISESIEEAERTRIITIINQLAKYYNNDLSTFANKVKTEQFPDEELYKLEEYVIYFCASTIAVGTLVKELTPIEELDKAVY